MGTHTDQIFKERHLDIGILDDIKMSVVEATETFPSWIIFVFLSIPVFVLLSYGVLRTIDTIFSIGLPLHLKTQVSTIL